MLFAASDGPCLIWKQSPTGSREDYITTYLEHRNLESDTTAVKRGKGLINGNADDEGGLHTAKKDKFSRVRQ